MALPNPSMSFSPFAILTAEELNDLVENIESLSDGSGLNNKSVTPNKIDLGGKPNYVATSENTASTSFVDLTTPGPSVTVLIGSNGVALVSLACLANATAANISLMSLSASGANTISPDTQYSAFINAPGTGNRQGALTLLLTGLNPGSTTFSTKYRVTASNSSFSQRHLAVVPL